MKKIGVLFFGIASVFAILALAKEGMSANMKRIIRTTACDIENVVIEVSEEVRSFVTEFEEKIKGID